MVKQQWIDVNAGSTMVASEVAGGSSVGSGIADCGVDEVPATLCTDDQQPSPSSMQWVLQQKWVQSHCRRVDLQPRAEHTALPVGAIAIKTTSRAVLVAEGLEIGSRSSEPGRGDAGGNPKQGSGCHARNCIAHLLL